MKTTIPEVKPLLGRPFAPSVFTLLVPVLVCCALAHVAQAVNPPPDGGYPGGNTAEGQNALLSLTSGIYNTAVGSLSLRALTEGQLNTAIGAGALLVNTADQNTATGAGALLSNTTGFGNTANGTFALFRNTEGFENTATGTRALDNNTTGSFNTAIGDLALVRDTTGNANTAIGDQALLNNTTAGGNTGVGYNALEINLTGDNNTATGGLALSNNGTGDNNTAVGSGALANNTTGGGNVALGFNAGESQTTGSNNVYIGAGLVGVVGESNACYIGSIFGQTSGGGAPVLINATGRLGTTTSSKRFKEEIKPMDKASDALFDLAPVTFRYKKEIDPKRTRQLGLVAEEVEQVNPDLVVRDKEGKPYSVRYDQVNAMLLNEFLKEHKAFLEEQCKVQEQRTRIEKQEATITELKKGIESVVAHLKEQDSKIQKVSAQIEVSKFANGRICRGGPTPKVALNKP